MDRFRAAETVGRFRKGREALRCDPRRAGSVVGETAAHGLAQRAARRQRRQDRGRRRGSARRAARQAGHANDALQSLELAARRGSYASAFIWNVHHMREAFLFFPLLILDALAMMIPGMALFKLGILNATRSLAWYARLAVAGFAVGLVTNLWELSHTVAADFDTLATMPIMVPTYSWDGWGWPSAISASS